MTDPKKIEQIVLEVLASNEQRNGFGEAWGQLLSSDFPNVAREVAERLSSEA
jgi:hypothetical protein